MRRHRKREVTVQIRWCGVSALVLAIISSVTGVEGASTELPSFTVVERTVHAHFDRHHDWRPGDLITRTDVKAILAKLEQDGWTVSAKQELLSETLADGDFLVRTLRSRDGLRFMRKVSGDKLVYDRLHRISAESGGQRLIRDLIKLPDGERYVKHSRGRAVPGMPDLLPKKRSGKTRKVANYREPTGQIYTQKQLLERLQQSYAEDSRQLKPTPGVGRELRTPTPDPRDKPSRPKDH